MGDSSQLLTNINIFLQKRASKQVKSTLVNIMPTLQFIFAMNQMNKKTADGIGIPGTPILVSSFATARAQQVQMFAAREYKPLVHHLMPTAADAKVMDDYDAKPVVLNGDTAGRVLTRFRQPRFKFVRLSMPFKVWHSEIETASEGTGGDQAQAAAAVGSLFEVERKDRLAALIQRMNNMAFGLDGGGGRPTDEDAVNWDRFHSFAAALSEDNTYGGIDRTVAANAWWKGHTISTATQAVFSDIIDYCNYDLGMTDKGLGIQLIAVGKTLFKIAKAEAKSENVQVTNDATKEYPEFGFRKEVVRINSGNRIVYIYYEPAMPAGHLLALDPATWTFAIHPKYNFKVDGPFDQHKNEGGDEADTGTIEVKPLLVCEVPSGNAYFSSVA